MMLSERVVVVERSGFNTYWESTVEKTGFIDELSGWSEGWVTLIWVSFLINNFTVI